MAEFPSFRVRVDEVGGGRLVAQVEGLPHLCATARTASELREKLLRRIEEHLGGDLERLGVVVEPQSVAPGRFVITLSKGARHSWRADRGGPQRGRAWDSPPPAM